MTEVREKRMTVRRTLAASRAFLFTAWTDPELLRAMVWPKGLDRR